MDQFIYPSRPVIQAAGDGDHRPHPNQARTTIPFLVSTSEASTHEAPGNIRAPPIQPQDAECLAVGWLAYNYSKWRVFPSPATFTCLASFQHPTMAQLQHGHPVGLDFIPWPQLRSHPGQSWHKYDYMKLTRYLSCCMKVR
ncbi:DUF3425 domain-containing protein [Aspergillus neoniger CBS 115656]|uniref:Uncharacterized protein n=1 Tax=Aspergillus neoniger (strain CBS 115656) TaxID=1448310 RepID=A0A318YKK7_ASPNB|nr:hypothetical protein BO87DRAFT_36861 [Aspergillus neoniger CBS 115656]PYH35075.1 hypothetical protein BO87DRAFT_36861 [Aspergillus neoniger CBS 115656]